jgi:hypothetical protein
MTAWWCTRPRTGALRSPRTWRNRPATGHARYLGSRSKECLPPVVIAWRAAHGLIAARFLTSIGYVWWCALSGRRGRFLRPAIAALVGEGFPRAADRMDSRAGLRATGRARAANVALGPHPARPARPDPARARPARHRSSLLPRRDGVRCPGALRNALRGRGLGGRCEYLAKVEAAGTAPASAEDLPMRLRAFPSESDLGGRFGRSAGHVPGATPS